MSNQGHFLESVDLATAKAALDHQGYFLVENACDANFCRAAIDFIDSAPAQAKTEINYGGSELRIWDTQSLGEKFEGFFKKSHETLKAVLGESPTPQTLLAIRNRAVDPNVKQLEMGRWHIDSFFKQMKVFLFLTDTTEESGAFECLPETHRRAFKFKMLCKGVYVKPADLLKKGGHRAYQKIDESLIERLSHHGYRSKPVIVKAGTVMLVNTSAIHRARPCHVGSRYALTAYFV